MFLLRISFLKTYLLSLYDKYGFGSGIHNYFSNKSITSFKNIMICAEEEYFTKKSQNIRIDMFIQNAKHKGIHVVVGNMFLFCWIKYFKLSFYDSIIKQK